MGTFTKSLSREFGKNTCKGDFYVMLKSLVWRLRVLIKFDKTLTKLFNNQNACQ